MITLLHQFLQFRLDLVLLVLLCTGACVLVNRFVLRRQPNHPIAWGVYVALGIVLVLGEGAAEWAARSRTESLTSAFAGIGPTYATELQAHGHARITVDTKPDDPTYLEIVEHEKEWLKANPVVADIYTFRADDQGRIRLIVDSETDYNHNGAFDEEREQRTPIGEIYGNPTPAWYRALAGERVFESDIMPDRWGVWVSSFTPVYGPDGKVEAAVGVDYPADRWLATIATARLLWLGVAAVLCAIILISATFIALLSGEIEQRKRAQQQLEAASESALAASAAKSEYLALMSHEVRTPLSAILGFANVLSQTRLDPIQRRYVETINRAGGSLLDFLNGILDYTRVESGKLQLEQIPWAPAILVHEVMELMAVRAEERGLEFDFDNRLPDSLTLTGDPTRIRQILLNLVANAVKFTAAGSVTVRAEWFPAAGGGDHGEFVVEVIDTGIGIAPAKLPQLFQAFSQADPSTARRHGGTGLGLAISKRLADTMRATLSLTSKLNVGTTCTFRLPTRSVSAIGPVSPGSAAMSEPQPVWGRALVVDDTRLNRELLKVMLQRLGLETDTAANGPEAVRFAAQHRYTVIFTDLEMPEMDGFATARGIRVQERLDARVPIIAVSALTTAGIREKCLAADMDDYLTKPVYLPALRAITEPLRTSTPESAALPLAFSDAAVATTRS